MIPYLGVILIKLKALVLCTTQLRFKRFEKQRHGKKKYIDESP